MQPTRAETARTVDSAFSIAAIFHSQITVRQCYKRRDSMKSITFPTCMAVMTVAAITGNSRAGGFASAQFGGAHGNAASDSLTSIFYNPAGLALDHGTRAYVEALAAYR